MFTENFYKKCANIDENICILFYTIKRNKAIVNLDNIKTSYLYNIHILKTRKLKKCDE